MHFVLVLAMLIGTSFFWGIGATAAGLCWIALWALAAVLWTRHAMHKAEES